MLGVPEVLAICVPGQLWWKRFGMNLKGGFRRVFIIPITLEVPPGEPLQVGIEGSQKQLYIVR